MGDVGILDITNIESIVREDQGFLRCLPLGCDFVDARTAEVQKHHMICKILANDGVTRNSTLVAHPGSSDVVVSALDWYIP